MKFRKRSKVITERYKLFNEAAFVEMLNAIIKLRRNTIVLNQQL